MRIAFVILHSKIILHAIVAQVDTEDPYTTCSFIMCSNNAYKMLQYFNIFFIKVHLILHYASKMCNATTLLHVM